MSSQIDGDLQAALLRELEYIVNSYPVPAYAPLNIYAAEICERRGWIRRDENNEWVPTSEGFDLHIQKHYWLNLINGTVEFDPDDPNC